VRAWLTQSFLQRIKDGHTLVRDADMRFRPDPTERVLGRTRRGGRPAAGTSAETSNAGNGIQDGPDLARRVDDLLRQLGDRVLFCVHFVRVALLERRATGGLPEPRLGGVPFLRRAPTTGRLREPSPRPPDRVHIVQRGRQIGLRDPAHVCALTPSSALVRRCEHPASSARPARSRRWPTD